MTAESPRPVAEGDALRYEARVDLSETNTARTQLVLMTGVNKKVLEVGPATGYITEALRDRGCRVTGLEIDPAAAERSGRFAERMIVGDIEALDLDELFGDERFDVVMFGDVLEHLLDPEEVLVRCRSILAPGGSIVASIPNVAHASVRLTLLSGQFRYRSDGLLDRTHVRFFTRESVETLFDTAGYAIDEIRTSTTDAFHTEMELRPEDYPERLVEAVMSLPDADTYQFILSARPSAEAERTSTGATAADAPPPDLEPLRKVEEELAERNRTIAALREEVAWLRQVAREAEAAREERAQPPPAQERPKGIRGWFPGGTFRGRAVRALVRPFRRRGGRRTGGQVRRPPKWDPDPDPDLVAGDPSYAEWIRRSEPAPEELDRQREASKGLAYRPLISVVIADIAGADLKGTLASVREQTYDHWELCVGEDAASALAAAAGEYLAFVAPGDRLPPFALYEVVRALDGERGAELISSDWDHISKEGIRTDPLFTPEWSPELLLSAGYLAHLLVAKREAVRLVGDVILDPDGTPSRDLLFRLTEQARAILRVPAVLYHRSSDRPSPALGAEGDAAGVRALEDHLRRTGRSGTVQRTPDGQVRVRWALEGSSRVSLIIPTRHSRELLTRCLSAIERATYANREVIVVETAPRDAAKERWYEELSRTFSLKVLWWDRTFNYSAVNNWGAAHASGGVLLFLNDDTEAVGTDWLSEMVGWAEQADIGAAGAQLLNEDGTIQHGGIVLGMTGFAGQLFKFLRPGDRSLLGSTMWYRNVLAVTGACLCMRREVFEQIGGWNERYLLAGSDVELGLRLRAAGYRVVCTPFAQLRHTEQATRGSAIPDEDFHTSFEDYRPYLLEGDPYFNPNLSYDATAPRLSMGESRHLETVSRIVGRPVDAAAPEEPQRTRLR